MKLQDKLQSVKWGIVPIVMHRGVLVEKLIGGYKVFGRKFLKADDVDKAIDQAQQSIQKSIK